MSTSDSIPSTFEWKDEHETILAQLASTNLVETEWPELKAILKYRISVNIAQMVNAKEKAPPTATLKPKELPSADLGAEILALWLVIPPFPPRPATAPSVVRILSTDLTEGESKLKVESLFKRLDEFEEAPFTIQRLCELVLGPQEHYNTTGKYIRALERTLFVTSGWSEYKLDTYADDPNNANSLANGTGYRSYQSLSQASTPLFSPIPFLANRSRSQSPTEGPSPLFLETRRPLPGDDLTEGASDRVVSSGEGSAVGLGLEDDGGNGMTPAMVRNLKVDELDHVSPRQSPNPDDEEAYIRRERERIAMEERFIEDDGDNDEADDENRKPSSSLRPPAEIVDPTSPTRRIAHLAEHPEAFSVVTTLPPNTSPGSPSQRASSSVSPTPAMATVNPLSPKSPVSPNTGTGRAALSPPRTLRSTRSSTAASSQSSLSPSSISSSSSSGIRDRFVRAGTPEPSPTRGLEEKKREEAEAAAVAAAAAALLEPGKGGEKKKKDNEEAEEGEVEDVIMKD